MIPLTLIALLTLASAVAAMTLRNLVHCALALAVTFAGLAATYLWLNAEFVGFAQILVYVGAVAILIVFAILLTRGSGSSSEAVFSSTWVMGVAIAIAVFAVLGGLALTSKALPSGETPPPEHAVRQIGDQLMTQYILPLEVLGLLLTTALIGAVILALQERRAE